MKLDIRLRRAVGAALAGSTLLLAPPAFAADFQWGEVSGTFDTTLSYGIQFRADDPDPNLIGKIHLNPAVAGMTPEQFIAAPGAFSANGDAGNLLYDGGDVISNAAKVNFDLMLRYDNLGFFTRAFYTHDFEIDGDSRISRAARERIGSHGDLLDAFVFGDWTFGEDQLPFSLRMGRQVVSWGESTFIQGGINTINPVDVSRLRVPGSELKEALLPVNSIWSSIGLSENISMELFVQTHWKSVKVDPAGTYWSTQNFVGRGGDTVLLGFGQFNAAQAAGAGIAVPRSADRNASNSGQFGAALRWFVPSWDTEFGFFALQYHSRLPILSATAVTSTVPASGRYYTEYPEDIRLYGVSFNTVWRGIALQGEYSYRPNQPLQIDDVELLYAALSPLNPLQPTSPFLSQLGTFAPGDTIDGYVRHNVGQAQMTATYLFGQNNPFRASNWVLLGEIGVTHVYDLPDQSVLRYEGPGTFTGGGADRTTGDLRNPVTQTTGFADATSWGYRLVTRVDYNNVWGAWNVSPRLSFQHDVSGTSPGPGGNFIEGRRSVSLGVNFSRLERFAIDASYTSYFGGGIHNQISDRDFFAIDFKYTF